MCADESYDENEKRATKQLVFAIIKHTMRAIIHQFDAIITSAIASWPAWLAPFFIAVTTLGSPLVTLPIGFFVALAGYYEKNTRLILSGIIVWITLGIGTLIKIVIARERPATEYAASITIDPMSFPSGHSSGATIAYGLLAYLAWQLLPHPWSYVVSGALALLIVLIGVSRVYLGAHFPSDVLAGWALGALALLVIIYLVRPFS